MERIGGRGGEDGDRVRRQDGETAILHGSKGADTPDDALAGWLAHHAGQALLALRARATGLTPAELRDQGDRLSHLLLTEALARLRPGDAVLSEEGADDRSRLGSPRVWVIDPLDGTREFGEEGRTDWAVHVALVEAGVPVAAAVSLPARGLPLSVSQTEALGWTAIVRSCSAWDAYKSIYGGEVHPRHVAEFLLLNEDFPRSVRFCVDGLNDALRHISGVSEGRFSNDGEKLAGRLVAELQFSTIEEIFENGLHDYLDQTQLKLNAIGEALFNTYIFHAFLPGGDGEARVQQEEQQQQTTSRPGRCG